LNDIDLALADISDIRTHVTASRRFEGIAPHLHTAIGGVVLLVAFYQQLNPIRDSKAYVAFWVAVMTLVGLVAMHKAVLRSLRMHGSMAREILRSVVQQVLPFFVAGSLITWIVGQYALEVAWVLPGIWQILIGLLGFTMMSRLPRGIVYASFWFMVTGACVLWIGAQTHSLSPWMMGIPLGIGQMLVGIMISYHTRRPGL